MLNSTFVELVVEAKTEQQELMLALLGDFPANGFEQTKETLKVYVAQENWSAETKALFEYCCTTLELPYAMEEVPAKNWNESWEAAFKPIQVGRFAGVRADFHPPFDSVTYDLLIHPRMAFGTGHHATTFMMMEQMSHLEWSEKAVFDFGCGTGILAILARLMGATPIDAVDIEPPATENTLVNMRANDVDGITVYTGDLHAVPVRQYDCILANINRNVILASLTTLYERLLPEGQLLVSGILQADQALVHKAASEAGFKQVAVQEREGWLMIQYCAA